SRRLPVLSLPFPVFRLPSSVFCPPSSVLSPPFSVLRSPSSVFRPVVSLLPGHPVDAPAAAVASQQRFGEVGVTAIRIRILPRDDHHIPVIMFRDGCPI